MGRGRELPSNTTPATMAKVARPTTVTCHHRSRTRGPPRRRAGKARAGLLLAHANLGGSDLEVLEVVAGEEGGHILLHLGERRRALEEQEFLAVLVRLSTVHESTCGEQQHAGKHGGSASRTPEPAPSSPPWSPRWRRRGGHRRPGSRRARRRSWQQSTAARRERPSASRSRADLQISRRVIRADY